MFFIHFLNCVLLNLLGLQSANWFSIISMQTTHNFTTDIEYQCFISGHNVIVNITSTSKEYWVPRVTATIQLPQSETIHNILGQLCFIFHRSYEMSRYKENYPCETQANNLLLYEKKRRLYTTTKDGKPIRLRRFGIKNGTELMLYYL